MKNPTPWPALLLVGLFATTAFAAFEAGTAAYTKRQETNLLAEPRPLAETTATLPHGRKLTIEEVKAPWLRVTDGETTGWVFQGNVSVTKPVEVKGLLDGVPQLASKTTVTAAARPLSSAAADYAAGRNLTSAQSDLEWIITECAAVTDEDVEAYLQAARKGAHQ